MPNTSRLHVILNVTHGCNLACRYCYYSREMAAQPGTMPLSTIEKVFRDAAASPAGVFQFTIHGGEPLLRRPSFFTEFFRLQRTHLAGKRVTNSIQTNGTLIGEAFVNTYLALIESGVHLGLGISLDGPASIHDRARVYKNDGRGSFAAVMRGIELLARHGIPVGVLAVAHLPAADSAPLLYPFFRSVRNLHSLDLLVPRFGSFPSAPDHGLSRIYTTLFDAWFHDDEASFDIRFFCSVIMAFLTGHGRICTFQKNCIRNNNLISIRPNGDVSFCDSYPEVVLGNIATESVDALTDGNHKQRRRLSMSEEARIERCLFCKWYAMCHGGCPTNHVPASGEPHYFCSDYQRIFAHVAQALESAQIRAGDGLSDENIDKFLNPCLRNYLRVRRTELEGPREIAS